MGLFPVLANGAGDPLTTLENAASEWVKTRMEAVRLETIWATEKPLLESTLAGMKERATALEEKRDLLRAKTADERAELEAVSSKMKVGAEELAGVGTQLDALTVNLQQLRAGLPPRLSAALDLPFRSLAGKSLSTGERSQLVATVLNRCGQFYRAITCTEEILTLEYGEALPNDLLGLEPRLRLGSLDGSGMVGIADLDRVDMGNSARRSTVRGPSGGHFPRSGRS